MAYLSFLDTNLAFLALGADNLKFSGYAYVMFDHMKSMCLGLCYNIKVV